jgi:hypothetical protein
MEFPAMGEHWVNPDLLLGGRFDAWRPTFLSYVVIAGRATLAGVGYAVPLSPGEGPPEIPGAGRVWHEHNGTVDEESVLSGHGGQHSEHRDGRMPHDVPRTRLAVLHSWVGVPNPAGVLEAENWALPFVRLGLAVPEQFPTDAARALALAGGGEPYFFALLTARRPTGGRGDTGAVRVAVAECRARVEAVLARRPRGVQLTAAELADLAGAWQRTMARLGLDSVVRREE